MSNGDTPVPTPADVWRMNGGFLARCILEAVSLAGTPDDLDDDTLRLALDTIQSFARSLPFHEQEALGTITAALWTLREQRNEREEDGDE